MDDWMAQLEDQTRKFPQESVLISFLLGALLQILAGHTLLLKLTHLMLWLASPIIVTFAAWRLYQLVRNREVSSAEESVAVNQS